MTNPCNPPTRVQRVGHDMATLRRVARELAARSSLLDTSVAGPLFRQVLARKDECDEFSKRFTREARQAARAAKGER